MREDVGPNLERPTSDRKKAYRLEIQMRRPRRNAVSVTADSFREPATSLALGLLALTCGTVVGFGLTFNAKAQNDADFGYPEALSTPVSARTAAATWCWISAIDLQRQTDDWSEAMRATSATHNLSYPRF